MRYHGVLLELYLAMVTASRQDVACRTGVKGFQKLMADTWTAGRRRMANGALTPERAVSPARQQGPDKRLGPSRGSSPLPTSPKSGSEDAITLSDDALQRRSPSARWWHAPLLLFPSTAGVHCAMWLSRCLVKVLTSDTSGVHCANVVQETAWK